MKKSMICIACPVGCHLEVDESLNVTGNRCKKGESYAVEEMTNPTRILTTTVAIDSRLQRRISVKSADPLPKAKLFDCIPVINKVRLDPPVKRGDIVVRNILDTGTDIIATRTIEE